MHAEAVISVEMDSTNDSDHLRKAFSEKQDKNVSYRTVIVQEAWQPPIKESISWIKSLRAATKGKRRHGDCPGGKTWSRHRF
jgi:hypothetical protein